MNFYVRRLKKHVFNREKNMSKEHYIWCEKYRPSNLDEYIGNEHIVEKVKIFLESGDVPHLLFYGIQGTGKTTVAKIIVNHVDCDHIYVNASDETSVDNVRNRIKNFAMAASFSGVKIVILDEADFLSPSAQAALRNLMETFSMNTRFILTCNYVEKIIDPVKSRCQTFEVSPPSRKEVAKHAARILQKEGIKFTAEDVMTIVNANYPDIRAVINNCQLYSRNDELRVDTQTVIEQNYMMKILDRLKNHVSSQKTYLDIRQIIADSKVKQFEPIFKFLYDNMNQYVSDLMKQAHVILIIADAQYHHSFVVDKEINIMSMFIQIIKEI